MGSVKFFAAALAAAALAAQAEEQTAKGFVVQTKTDGKVAAISVKPEKGDGAPVEIAPESFSKMEEYDRQDVAIKGEFKKGGRQLLVNSVTPAKVVKGVLREKRADGKTVDMQIEPEGGAGLVSVALESMKKLEGLDGKPIEAIGFMSADGRSMIVDFATPRKTVKGEVLVSKGEGGKIASISIKGGKEAESVSPSSFGKLESLDRHEVTAEGYMEWDGKRIVIESVSSERKEPPKKAPAPAPQPKKK